MYHTCPACEGRGTKPDGFYEHKKPRRGWPPVKCRSCDGRGYLGFADKTVVTIPSPQPMPMPYPITPMPVVFPYIGDVFPDPYKVATGGTSANQSPVGFGDTGIYLA